MAEPPVYDFDLFLSYAKADHAWVEGYLLPALSLPADRVLTPVDFLPGASLAEQIEHAVESSRFIGLLVTPAFLNDSWAIYEDHLVTHAAIAERRDRVVPILLEPCKLPLHVDFRVPLDFTQPEHWEAEAKRFRELFNRTDPGEEVIDCPYPGMVAFSEADARHLYGRHSDVREAIECLRLHPLLAIVGPSGSGKSSLVFAGVIPGLRRDHRFGSGAWEVRALRPGPDPLDELTRVLGGDPANPEPAVQAALASAPDAKHLLIVVDQFEEIFTVSRDDTVPFQEAVQRLARVPACSVVLTVRADFYPELMMTPLWNAIRGHRLEVLPLDEQGLRAAIVQPALDVGVHIDQTLVEQLVDDAAGEPGVLPLVQETLVCLWEERKYRYLALRAYEELATHRKGADESDGVECTGLQVAMARRADDALESLCDDPPENVTADLQPLAHRIFLRLVQFGEGRADTRRQQPIASLGCATDLPQDVEATVNHFADRRILTLTGTEGDSNHRVDIAHEALISGWPHLRRWVAERRVAELMRRRLEAKAEEWVERGKGVGGLLDEDELNDASKWLISTDAEELGCSSELWQLAQASRSREALRERSRYFGQAAGGAVGAGLGYALLVSVNHWAMNYRVLAPPSERRTVDHFPPHFQAEGIDALFVKFNSGFPLGALVGLSMGIGLWRAHGSRTTRLIVTTVLAIITSIYGLVMSFGYSTTRSLFEKSDQTARAHQLVLTGAILGAGIGLGVSVANGRKTRVISTTLCTTIAACIALYADENSLRTKTIFGNNLALAIIAGLALGVCTGLGFAATAVMDRKSLTAPEVSKWERVRSPGDTGAGWRRFVSACFSRPRAEGQPTFHHLWLLRNRLKRTTST
jgi:hypothetical protein